MTDHGQIPYLAKSEGQIPATEKRYLAQIPIYAKNGSQPDGCLAYEALEQVNEKLAEYGPEGG